MNRDDSHWDEGTIHAWLDGEVDPPTSAALEAHVASCHDCAALVAEARGLVASASRIVGALDDVPSAARPPFGATTRIGVPEPAGRGTAWRFLRATPARSAIAATLLVALGVTLTRERTGPQTISEARRAGIIADSAAPTSEQAAIESQGAAAPDSLLRAAIARNVAQAQPPRAVRAAPGPTIPAPPPPATAATADTTAALRVAVGRAATRSVRETTAGLGDRATVGTPVRPEDVVAAATAAQKAAAPAPTAAVGARSTVAPGAECLRVESATGSRATWGPITLPFVAALDSSGRARLFGADGAPVEASGTWSRRGGDSVDLRLRRIGYTGTIALGARGDARAGVMRSAPTASALEQMVVTSRDTSTAAGNRAARGEATQRRIPVRSDATAPTAADQNATIAAPAVPVVATRVGCP